MKKILSVLLSAAVLLTATACNNSNSDPAPSNTTSATTTKSDTNTHNLLLKNCGVFHPRFKRSHLDSSKQRFLEAAKLLGWNAEILDPNDNLENQISQIRKCCFKEC